MNIYNDIAQRTQGDIYIGVVGPVRTGKSTFIKRFMDLKVLPNIDNVFKKERAKDELPQSAAGRTIMTTEPKFVPNEAVTINIDDATCRVRMIDCVGYMVNGALGASEDGEVRMVQTPWDSKPMPFNQAAEIGTRKVICEHSTIGLVITTDGSITDIPREDYIEAEERVINELKEINKPFIVLLNSENPRSTRAVEIKSELEEKYSVPVMCVSCADLNEGDVSEILEAVLYEFPLREIGINLPGWLDALDFSHPLKEKIYTSLRSNLKNVHKLREAKCMILSMKDNDYAKDVRITGTDLGSGAMIAEIITPDELFYSVLSDSTGFEIDNDSKLLRLLCNLREVKEKYDKISYALQEVEAKGYGIVNPTIDELSLEEPEIIKQGGRFGVRLRASAPSIHMMRSKQRFLKTA